MAYLVNLTARAARDLALLYGHINAEDSEAALKWYRGFKEAILSLEGQPNRCPVSPESDRFRHLLYGNKPHIYRAIYRVLEKQKQVEVLHIRHGARRKFKGADVAWTGLCVDTLHGELTQNCRLGHNDAMSNGANNTTSAAAPSISTDFLIGSTEIGLDRIRTRLLDLTNRNKLLNFRHSPASSLRVVDVPIDAVFRQLRDTDKLAFHAVPEPEITFGEVPPAKDYADELGWKTSFDLDNEDESVVMIGREPPAYPRDLHLAR